jgi:hypothetical protein
LRRSRKNSQAVIAGVLALVLAASGLMALLVLL